MHSTKPINNVVHYSLEDILQMEDFFRRYLMNTVTGYKSASLIGTKSKSGQSNLALFNSVIHIGATPPCMGFVMRPTTVTRHTYENIKETGFFTINQVHEGIYKAAHQTSARYPKDVSEFEACGFNEEYLAHIPAPMVKESVVKFALSLDEEHEIKVNGTILIVGRVQQMMLPMDTLAEDGFVDLNKAGTVTITGLDCYHRPERLARLSYAKVDKDVEEI